MSDLASPIEPFRLPADDSEATKGLPAAAQPAATTPPGAEAVRWGVVARLPGLMQATIVAGRLQAAGIPARAWQEGAGRAFGLTVGLLGTGYVTVPEAHVAQALEILAAEADFDEEE